MSTERLTPEEVLHAELLGHLQYRLKEKVLIAMKDYATQEVEHKTKQLQEERANILESLFSIRDMVHGTPWAIVNKLIDQLNQENEG